MPKRMMIIAGEASGDYHGANLVKAILKKRNDIEFFGIGGRALKQAGVRIVVDAADLSVVGITEVFVKLPNLLRGLDKAKRALRQLRPSLLICIDFPDFNLKTAATAKALGIPVLYYISPQIWAWRAGRVEKIGRLVDHMAVILPFEADFYRKKNISVSYVGHPLLDGQPEKNFCSDAPETFPHPVIGLLPGSRDREVARHIPVMLAAADRLSEKIEGVRFILSVAPSLSADEVRRLVRSRAGKAEVSITEEPVGSIFHQCSLVIAASGTVALESAIACVPLVVIYKVSPSSYWLGRALIKVDHISLVNLIAGKTVIPELIQDQATPENISKHVTDLFDAPGGLETMRRNLRKVRGRLGASGASEKTAAIALRMINGV